ncbi:prepilin peptidase [Macrococcus lamae]|uniref:Prepilin peptidase n=1 Tax=Macrococcus lamae TaxID=198484 RepID=A0A4V3BF81_9STAP|nr:A24 family peptidase [Macrococcus lamae]TDM13026.1 prepilin peptidase [Macrococcus lamae]
MWAIIVGSMMGSFMLCVLYAEDTLLRRSQCDHCGKFLTWHELIPVVSFILQKGKCRSCGQPIPGNHIITELLFALLFLLFTVHIDDMTGNRILLICFLVPLAIYDTHHFRIPNHMTVLFFLLLLIFNFDQLFNFSHLLYSSVLILLLHLFYFLTKGIGYGDIKLLAVMSLFLPWQYFILIFMLSYIIGGIAAIIFLFYKNQLKKIPLVPFITTSTIIVLIYYDELHSIYFGGFIN